MTGLVARGSPIVGTPREESHAVHTIVDVQSIAEEAAMSRAGRAYLFLLAPITQAQPTVSAAPVSSANLTV